MIQGFARLQRRALPAAAMARDHSRDRPLSCSASILILHHPPGTGRCHRGTPGRAMRPDLNRSSAISRNGSGPDERCETQSMLLAAHRPHQTAFPTSSPRRNRSSSASCSSWPISASCLSNAITLRERLAAMFPDARQAQRDVLALRHDIRERPTLPRIKTVVSVAHRRCYAMRSCAGSASISQRRGLCSSSRSTTSRTSGPSSPVAFPALVALVQFDTLGTFVVLVLTPDGHTARYRQRLGAAC